MHGRRGADIQVTYRPESEADLDQLFEYLAVHGSVELAERLVSRILDACSGLSDFPHRGSPRTDLLPNGRIVTVDGRVVIAYRVLADRVQIVGVFYAGRDAAGALQSRNQLRNE